MPLVLAAFWVCAAACLVAHVGILRSVVHRSGREASSPDVPRPNVVVEIIWAVVPMVVLAVVLLATLPHVRHQAYMPHHDMSTMSSAR
jgi:heme/copper-type cytochrome/quinol oxidase subunit 2